MHGSSALADMALREQRWRYDLVYPMLYCYRHAVETGLKWLITQYGPPVGVKPQNINDTHDLLKLWRDFRRINDACGAAHEVAPLRPACAGGVSREGG